MISQILANFEFSVKQGVFSQIRLGGKFAVNCLSNIVPWECFSHKFWFFCKEITICKVWGIRKFHEGSAFFEKKNNFLLNGFVYLKQLFLPQTSRFLQKIKCWRFGEETTFCWGNGFSFRKASSAKIEGWKTSRGSRLPCLSSLPVS